MTAQGFKRRLTAILHADVKGYSRLIGEDEDATVSTLTTYREVMGVLFQKHRGRVVHGTGDSLLAEFISVIDAVQCAVEIQKELETRNAELPEDRKVEFRIGINLGDVIDKDEDLHGDGVNIAARIEGLAEGGGICISRTAFDQVRNKLKLGYEYIGKHSVKNITQPVRVYRVLMEPESAGKVLGEKKMPQKQRWKLALAAVVFVIIGAIGVTLWNTYLRPISVEVASVEKMAYPLPDKPSIAVLPFVNMSGDPKQEFFSDGITEHIITSLSKVPYIFVIARNSTFSYKNKSVKVQQISEELGVQYVLEGSVQRSDDRVRITTQLIDAIAGHYIWAENYDREVRDIFSLQDEIAMKIMAEMQVKFTVEELGRLAAIKTKNLKAYEKYLMGYDYFWRRTEGDTQHARKLAQEAIFLDPEYGAPYILLARTYLDDVWYYKTKPAAESLETAERLVQKSIELSGQDSIAYQILGNVYSLRRQYDKAIAECQKAIDLRPNSAEANYFYGQSLRWAGRFDEAILAFKKAIRLNPITPMNYLNNIAWAYGFSEQYEKAISIWNKAIERNPDYFFAYLGLTLVYQLLDNELKAREAAAEVMRLKPNLTISKLEKGPATKNIDRKRMFEALHKAGIPE